MTKDLKGGAIVYGVGDEFSVNKSKGELKPSWWESCVIGLIKLLSCLVSPKLVKTAMGLSNDSGDKAESTNVPVMREDQKDVKVSVSRTPPASPPKPARPAFGGADVKINPATKQAEVLLDGFLRNVTSSDKFFTVTKQILALDTNVVLKMVKKVHDMYYGTYVQGVGKLLVTVNGLSEVTEKFFAIDASKMQEDYSSRCSSITERAKDALRVARVTDCLKEVRRAVVEESRNNTSLATVHNAIIADIDIKVALITGYRNTEVRQQTVYSKSVYEAMSEQAAAGVYN